MQMTQEEVLKNLQDVRERFGEEAYIRARNNLARMLMSDPNGEAFIKRVFPDLDLESLGPSPAATLTNEDLLAAIRTHVPSIKTQAEFDLFQTAFKALCVAFNATYQGEDQVASAARDALNVALDTAAKVRTVASQLEELPPENVSAQGRTFIDPPKEFTEVEEQRRLLAELDAVTTVQGLNDWYSAQRSRIDGVVTPKYRDPLFDAIRSKKAQFSN